jgi:colanic acid/amylovoran biosynthesis glycosyltransferase
MRIIYVTSRLPFGPGEAFIIPEISYLKKMGHQVVAIPLLGQGKIIHDDVKPLLNQFIIKRNCSPNLLWAAIKVGFKDIYKMIKFLYLIMSLRNPIRLLKNLLVFPKALWLADLAKRWEADHIHAHWATSPATIAMVASNFSNIPWSFTAHRGDIVENDLLEEKICSASFVRTISQTSFLLFKNLHLDIPERKKKIIHMGVNLPSQSTLQNQTSGQVSIACPANLIPVKGHRFLIDALKLLSAKGLDFKVHFFGDGNLKISLKKHIASAGLSDVALLHGAIPHNDLLDLYKSGQIQIMVLPSIDLGGGHHEGIPVSLMEAMSHCIPVISTATGGIPELLSDKAGVIVEPANPKSMAEGLEPLIRDKQLRKIYGQRGREKVEKEFSCQYISSELVQCFDQSTYHL